MAIQWTIKRGGVPIVSWCAEVDALALQQAKNVAALPMAFDHVALMPDCHTGFGMPIGGVLACRDAVIPNAVGVDIGCGVMAVRTSLSTDRLDAGLLRCLLREWRRRIPTGFDHQGSPQPWGEWNAAPLHVPPVKRELDAARYQLGTLGGGNHFLELQASEDGRVWLMAHSGSRNFGLKIAEYYHAVAVDQCRRERRALPAPDLAWLTADSGAARDYLAAMEFALRFAARNRECLMDTAFAALAELAEAKKEATRSIHHNYCAEEEHFGVRVYLHRKGATAAGKGQEGIVPGSMGSPSYIVSGLGNPQSFMSCSHGAGRRLGRRQAGRELTVVECDRAMRGIVFGGWNADRKGRPDFGEAPQAYKDIDAVMQAQNDLAKVETRLRPLAVLKG